MIKRLISILLLILAVSGCSSKNGSSTAATGGYTFTDDLGRKITVDDPKRVAALIGSYADIWHLAGGTVCASADDAWDDFKLDMPDDAIDLGATKSLSLEKLFEAEPDFILASCNTRVNMEWKDILENSNIPTAYFDVSDFDDYLRVLKICTEITGRDDLYSKNGLEVKSQVEKAIDAAAKGKEQSVLLIRATAASVYVKNSVGNVAGEMLKNLGCVNIADSDKTLIENISLERIIQADPDRIFILQFGDDREGMEKYLSEQLFSQPGWAELTAVKEGRVHFLEKRLYSLKPNARWGEAYQKLQEVLSNEG